MVGFMVCCLELGLAAAAVPKPDNGWGLVWKHSKAAA